MSYGFFSTFLLSNDAIVFMLKYIVVGFGRDVSVQIGVTGRIGRFLRIGVTLVLWIVR